MISKEALISFFGSAGMVPGAGGMLIICRLFLSLVFEFCRPGELSSHDRITSTVWKLVENSSGDRLVFIDIK